MAPICIKIRILYANEKGEGSLTSVQE